VGRLFTPTIWNDLIVWRKVFATMPLNKSKCAVLLPIIFTSVHILLTVIAEVQYRTGWLYIPPTVEFDPTPLPVAGIAAMWLSLPAYVVSLVLSKAASQTLGLTIEGTSQLMLEIPFIIGFWWVVGRWFDSRKARRSFCLVLFSWLIPISFGILRMVVSSKTRP
jgi:hypothetical protein